MKKNFTTIRELWAVPKYRTIIKLSFYFVFFAVFFILASVDRPINVPIKNQDSNNLSYAEMKKKLSENNLKVKYNINSYNDYFFEGTIINNIFSGTVETSEMLKKIKIEKEAVYLIEKNKEILVSDLLSDINLIYLFPANITRILSNNSSQMKQNENQKTYTYNIDNKQYTIYSENNMINKILLFDGKITYELEVEIIN